MKPNLSPKQKEALQFFLNKKNGCSTTSLAREMKCDKALAAGLIRAMTDLGALNENGNGMFTISREGRQALGAPDIPDPHDVGKLEALDLPPSKQTLQALAEMVSEDVMTKFEQARAEGLDQVSFNVKKSGVLNIENGQATFTPDPEPAPSPEPQTPTLPGADQIVFTAPTGDWGKLPAPDRADFATLVRQGMARLNAQLGLQPVAIENAALKVETLEFLAESIGATNEPHVYTLLRAIAQDVQRISERSSK